MAMFKRMYGGRDAVPRHPMAKGGMPEYPMAGWRRRCRAG